MDLLDTSFHIPAHILATPAGNEIAMLDVEQDRYLSLNISGAKIWRALSEGLTGQQIADRVAQDYGIDADRAQKDTTALLANLVERGMIQIAGDSAGE